MRIDLLLANRKFYTWENYAAKEVEKVFEKHRIAHRKIFLSDGHLQDYLSHIHHDPPTWTLSFENLTPHEKPLCDVLRIPHFYWVHGSFGSAVRYLTSDFGRVGLSDEALCQRLANPRFIHLPQGVDSTPASVDKRYDVVFFADLIDLDFLHATWEELFSAEEIQRIKDSIKFKEPLQAASLFFYAEQYLNAQKDYQIMTSLKDVRLDVFGEHAGNNWLTRLPDSVYLHSKLPYIEHFEILKESKIVLLEPASEWYWPAVALDCLPLPPSQEKVSYFLSHPEERHKTLAKLKPLQRSWEKQTQALIEYMSI